MAAYVESLLDRPDASWPLHRLADQIETATLKAMKGRPTTAKDWVVKRAVRDVAFLFFVHQEANERILQEWPTGAECSVKRASRSTMRGRSAAWPGSWPRACASQSRCRPPHPRSRRFLAISIVSRHLHWLMASGAVVGGILWWIGFETEVLRTADAWMVVTQLGSILLGIGAFGTWLAKRHSHSSQ